MEVNELPIEINLEEKTIINGILTVPTKRLTWTDFAIVLTHGAGGDMNLPQLNQLSKAVSTAGFLCLRFSCKTPNFSYRVRCFAAAVKYLKDNEKYKIKGCIIGGRSMGGRVAAELATANAKDDSFILGVFCLSYPLHRPKRYNELRVSHLIHLSLPILFISGTKDAMCRTDLMENTIDRMANNVRVHWLYEADHALNIKGKMDIEVLSKICQWTVTWIQSVVMAER